ncbi:hypothetical protein KOW79_020492 [Hemibagrus wyckioides]|uniref:Uncharacterized protein n=1 Tax=Hemibagrus wyckioides TaxID=337641 RepID=A0A9D3N310_9TELE|nr:hypothetical protein KOW79_020492 [Hemibagrus wyckioides]
MCASLYEQYELKARPCIDLMRALGVEKDLALPTIAVIGDQSSGRARCWRRCPESRCLNIDRKIAGPVGISDKLISLEVTSADVPDLTLIDLPGIVRVPMKGQPEDIGEQSKRLIRNVIEKQGTIILVVVPCNVDISTTEALKMAQEVDPNGERTLGILTKPDLVDKGAEEDVISIINNDIIYLAKGYMIVKCRGQQKIQDRVALYKATETEEDFFENHPQFRFNKSIEKELREYEKKYRGREIPCFLNYKTFEVILKDQLEKLEEPSINKLKEISGVIRNEFIQLAQYSFPGFPNLLKSAKNKIENIKQVKESEAESILRTQFKMELMISTQDSIYKEALYKISTKRLADQVPLVIRYMVVQESAKQLEREMLQLIQGNVNFDELLKEDHDISSKKNNLKSRQKWLRDAAKRR